jgi:hypothetical protein
MIKLNIAEVVIYGTFLISVVWLAVDFFTSKPQKHVDNN